MSYPIPKSTIIKLSEQFNDTVFQSKPSNYWDKYLHSGTSLWLDTGDIVSAKKIWAEEFSALTTNNTLLNNEVQKGIYDNTIPVIAKHIKENKGEYNIQDIAFCLNAIHGLRLVKIFNCNVSVELHTDIAHNINQIAEVGASLHSICPKHFIIKVPFTSAGLIGARKLHDKGIPVNFTLDFSVRQNIFASVVAQAQYSNVFLGRLGAYLKNNKLGEGLYIGEKVTLETQHCLRSLINKNISKTKLIAASIRSPEQLQHLLGTDIFTIPSKVADEAIKAKLNIDGSHINEIPEPELFDENDVKKLRLKHLWQAQDHEKEIVLHLNEKLPNTAAELEEYAHNHGCHDLFPKLDKKEHQTLREDGKIPIHKKWNQKIINREIGIDSLLNIAGLYSFMHDQAQLDKRIQKYI
ncbi:transaldolase family protein [Carboxylicivirga sp. N1Y90]|uniref:transaldolase family protein n=1 Tax=Carboxylicivirga fragile TaxID=3417571 RepID=UPI003D350F35|nr:transaldolase [Marinilabiliaceae bacterium N1Y90]